MERHTSRSNNDGAQRQPNRRRVPVRLQMTGVECGAACLAMILSYHGRDTSVGECRDVCFPGRGGLTAKTLAEAARSLGLEVKAYSTSIEALATLPLPAIAHWGFNHFVVLERLSGDAVHIVDPSSGRRRVSMEEFSGEFTGVLLTFAPTPGFSREGRPAVVGWSRIVTTFVRDKTVRGALFHVLGASIFLQATGLLLPLLTKGFIDVVAPFRATDLLPMLAWGMGIFLTARLFAGYVRAFTLLNLRNRLDDDLMHTFMRHLLALPFSFFQHRSTGDLLMRLGSNGVLRELLSNQVVGVLLDGSVALVYLAILLVAAPVLAVLTIGIACLQLAIVLTTQRTAAELAQREFAARATEQGYLTETVAGILLVKAGGHESAILAKWSNLFRGTLNVGAERGILNSHIDSLLATLRTAAPLLMLWFGAREVMAGSMSMGTMLAANAIAAAFLQPLGTLIATAQQLPVIKAYAERLADVFNEPIEETAPIGTARIALAGSVEVDRLSFHYDGTSEAVVADVSFCVPQGSKLAIVGATGSGKSTLARLLVHIHQPTSGTIRFDGHAIPTIGLASLRQQVAIVLQDTSLFSGSILRNLLIGGPDVGLDEVEHAARLAEIHDEIRTMPMGYETEISEGGSALSGGQRQRLAIARALLQRPRVLILDEATSHLDAITEAKVHANLGRLQCTRVVISHRVSPIADADQIIVLERGRIIERGTHDSLLRAEGAYDQFVRASSGNVSSMNSKPGGIRDTTERFLGGRSNWHGAHVGSENG